MKKAYSIVAFMFLITFAVQAQPSVSVTCAEDAVGTLAGAAYANVSGSGPFTYSWTVHGGALASHGSNSSTICFTGYCGWSTVVVTVTDRYGRSTTASCDIYLWDSNDCGGGGGGPGGGPGGGGGGPVGKNQINSIVPRSVDYILESLTFVKSDVYQVAFDGLSLFDAMAYDDLADRMVVGITDRDGLVMLTLSEDLFSPDAGNTDLETARDR